MLRRLTLALLVVSLACGDDASPPMDGSLPDGMLPDDASDATVDPAPTAVLFVHALDLWGQALPVDPATHEVRSAGELV